jgi:hypothetical protein
MTVAVDASYMRVNIHMSDYRLRLEPNQIESLYNCCITNNMHIETEHTLYDVYNKSYTLLPSPRPNTYKILKLMKYTNEKVMTTISKSALIEIFILYELVYKP